MNSSKIKWPDGAQCAALITVNLDAEFFWLSLSPDSVNRPKTLSMGQYGMDRGLERVLDVLDRYGVKATFFAPGRVAEVYPIKLQEIIQRGHEIALQGYEHENYGHMTTEKQKISIEKGVAAFERVCGAKPIGFRAPEGELTFATMKLIREMGFKYSSSLFGDDRPYFMKLEGKQSDLVEIPLHWELNDFPYFAFNYGPAFPIGQDRIAHYNSVLSTWIDEYRAFYKYGLCYVLQIDPQTIGTPGRIKMLDSLLEFITAQGSVHFGTCGEIAEYWAKQNKG